MAEEKTAPKLVINAGTVTGSTYAQLASVTVTDIDITIEFVFINPRDATQSQVVSRVTMPKNVGIDLAQRILMTNKIHDKRKAGNKND